MYNKIIIPLDGSRLAESVLPYIKPFIIRASVEVTLLRICDSPESVPSCKTYLEGIAEVIRHEVEEVAAKDIPIGNGQIKINIVVSIGHPAEEIIRHAEEKRGDLILMATHGYSGIRRWIIGSVADKVLRRADVPIWLVRVGLPASVVPDKMPIKTLVVPLDGSKAAESVLRHVEALARNHDAQPEVILMNVVEPMLVTSDYPESSMALTWSRHVALMKDYYRRQARKYLLEITKRLLRAGINARITVLTGKPAERIIEFSRRHQGCLVFLTAFGLSSLGGWELGHTADKVLHRSISSIFLVRPTKKEDAYVQHNTGTP